jgi:hypothetical protein
VRQIWSSRIPQEQSGSRSSAAEPDQLTPEPRKIDHLRDRDRLDFRGDFEDQQEEGDILFSSCANLNRKGLLGALVRQSVENGESAAQLNLHDRLI